MIKLRYIDKLDSYDLNDYIKYRYSIDNDHHMMEIDINIVSGTNPVYNFIYAIYNLYNLYKLDSFTVIYKNYKYFYHNGKIQQLRMY